MKKIILCLSLAFSMNLIAVESVGGFLGLGKGEERNKCSISCADGSSCKGNGIGVICACQPSAYCGTPQGAYDEVDNLSDYLRAREADAR